MTVDIRKISKFIETIKKNPVKVFIISGILFSLIAFALISGVVITEIPPEKDGVNNLAIAYNVARYGVVTRDIHIKKTPPKPLLTREPLYPFYVSLFVRSVLPEDVELKKLLEKNHYIKDLKIANIVLFIVLTWCTGAAAWFILDSAFLALLPMFLISVNAILLETADTFYTELPGALLMIVASALFALSWKKKELFFSVPAGVALALLAYVKAVFFYFLLLLFPLLMLSGLMLFMLKKYRKVLIPIIQKVLIICLTAMFLIIPWLVRNYNVTNGKISFATRGSRILAIRAEYDSLKLKEQGASFIVYSRFLTSGQKKKILGDKLYSLYDRQNAKSVYRRFNRKNGNYYAFKKEHSLKGEKAPLLMMLKYFPKHLFMTLAFAHRSFFLNDALKQVRLLSLLWTVQAFILMPFFLASIIIAYRNKDMLLGVFLLLSLYSFSFHAFFTHYIRRYNDPLIPVLLISFLYCCKAAYTSYQRKFK